MNSRTEVRVLLIFALLTVAGCGRSPSERPDEHQGVTGSAASSSKPQSPNGIAGSSGNPSERPTDQEVLTAARRLVLENSENVRTKTLNEIQIAQDRKGEWWVSALVIPEDKKVDEAIIFMHKGAGGWELIDLGTGVVPHELPIPEEVRGSLRQ